MLGSRAIYHQGWKATTDHVGPGLAAERVIPGSRHFDEDHWSLYHLDDDFAEADDLADEHPERLARLVERWWSEAGANQVLPLGDDMVNRLGALEPSPWGPRWLVELAPGGGPVAEEVLPPQLFGFELTATVTVGSPAPSTEGAIATLGDWSNGWALYLLDGRPVFALTTGADAAAPGRRRPARPPATTPWWSPTTTSTAAASQLRLAVDGDASSTRPRSPTACPSAGRSAAPACWSVATSGSPCTTDYQPPFAFGGTIDRVVLAVPAMAPSDADVAAEIAAALRQE